MKKERNTRGITLIALVVTIIVLIILAVVSINMVFNENGLIKQAEKAKEYQANAVESDQGTLERYANYINGDSDDEVGEDNEDNIEKIGDFYKGNAGKINIKIPEDIPSPEEVKCTLYKVGTINRETIEWDPELKYNQGFTSLNPTVDEVESTISGVSSSAVVFGTQKTEINDASEAGVLMFDNLEKNSVYCVLPKASGYTVNYYLVGVLENDSGKAFEIVPKFTKKVL